MKQTNAIASVILAAAVLIAAYAIGRLIRQTRLDVPEAPPRVVEPNDFRDPNVANVGRPAGARRRGSTTEERAKIKEERLETLAQRSDMTEDEKAQYRDEMRRQLRARGRDEGPGRIPRLSPEELAGWSEMTDEERAALRARIQGRLRRGQRVPPKEVDQNQPSLDGAAAPSEPNDPNQN